MRSALGLALLAALGCAHPGAAAPLALEAPARATARAGAARVMIAVVNPGPAPAALDPARFTVSVRAEGGEALSCRPGLDLPRREVAAGERVPVQVDLSVACGLDAPGAYRVEVRYGEGAAAPRAGPVALTVTRWTNPGPLPRPRPVDPSPRPAPRPPGEGDPR